MKLNKHANTLLFSNKVIRRNFFYFVEIVKIWGCHYIIIYINKLLMYTVTVIYCKNPY